MALCSGELLCEIAFVHIHFRYQPGPTMTSFRLMHYVMYLLAITDKIVIYERFSSHTDLYLYNGQ